MTEWSNSTAVAFGVGVWDDAFYEMAGHSGTGAGDMYEMTRMNGWMQRNNTGGWTITLIAW